MLFETFKEISSFLRMCDGMVDTNLSEVDGVETVCFQLDLGTERVFTQHDTVHAVSLRLHVQRQRLRLALDDTADVEVDLFVALRAEAERDELAGVGLQPAAHRRHAHLRRVARQQQRRRVEREMQRDRLVVEETNLFRRLVAYNSRRQPRLNNPNPVHDDNLVSTI